MFNYSVLNSIACREDNKSCLQITIKLYFIKGEGLIIYKNYIDFLVIFKIKFFLYYLKIINKNKKFNLYISIKPFNFKKYNGCINLSIFMLIILAFFNLSLKKSVLVMGDIDIKTGKILKIDNLINKTYNFSKKFKLIISNKMSFSNILLHYSFLNFEYISEVYFFIKRCLTQRKSNGFTRR